MVADARQRPGPASGRSKLTVGVFLLLGLGWGRGARQGASLLLGWVRPSGKGSFPLPRSLLGEHAQHRQRLRPWPHSHATATNRGGGGRGEGEVSHNSVLPPLPLF